MTAVLALGGVSCRFASGRGRYVQAVDDVSLTVEPGEAVGLVGESGCGKSTLARLVNRLIDADAGSICLDGRDIGAVPPRRFARDPARAAVQMVFQDATDSLDPHLTAAASIAAPVQTLLRLGRAGTAARVREVAAQAGLSPELLPRYPHQLSGGQKARVGIARALATRPRLLVLDEPTSALDVSMQAVVMRLLDELRQSFGVSLLFISHDLAVVRLMCSRVTVMLLGQVVETGPANALFDDPLHPYTRALVDSVPDPVRRGRKPPAEQEMSVALPTPACRYAGLCPEVHDRCWTERPPHHSVGAGRTVACHNRRPVADRLSISGPVTDAPGPTHYRL